MIHEQGLVTVIGELHDELDAVVLGAYGWGDLAAALVGKPGGTTPSAGQSAEQAAEEDLLGRHGQAQRRAHRRGRAGDCALATSGVPSAGAGGGRPTGPDPRSRRRQSRYRQGREEELAEESNGAIQSAEDGTGRAPGPRWRGAV